MAIRRRNRFEKVIDEIRWAGSNSRSDAQSAGSVGQTFITDGARETVMRMRGELVGYIDGASAPGKLVECRVGIHVVQAGIGTSVTLNPFTNADAPWWFYEAFVIGYEEMVTDVVGTPGLSVYRKMIDTKSMRILKPGEEMQIVFTNTTLQVASAVNMSLAVRVLLGSK